MSYNDNRSHPGHRGKTGSTTRPYPSGGSRQYGGQQNPRTAPRNSRPAEKAQPVVEEVPLEPITARLRPQHLQEKVSAYGRVKFVEVVDEASGAKARFERGHYERKGENVKTLILTGVDVEHPLYPLWMEHGKVQIEISTLIGTDPLATDLSPGKRKLLTFMRGELPRIGWRPKGERY